METENQNTKPRPKKSSKGKDYTLVGLSWEGKGKLDQYVKKFNDACSGLTPKPVTIPKIIEHAVSLLSEKHFQDICFNSLNTADDHIHYQRKTIYKDLTDTQYVAQIKKNYNAKLTKQKQKND